MAEPSKAISAQAPLVAVVSWLVPGAGYLILGQKARGLTVGITILALFFAGLLISGVRCLEVAFSRKAGGKMDRGC
jgi:TM2 domain-containing membrane protein YozV